MFKQVCSAHLGSPSFCEQTRLKTLLFQQLHWRVVKIKNTIFESDDNQVRRKLLLLRCSCFCLVSLIKTNNFVSGFLILVFLNNDENVTSRRELLIRRSWMAHHSVCRLRRNSNTIQSIIYEMFTCIWICVRRILRKE